MLKLILSRGWSFGSEISDRSIQSNYWDFFREKYLEQELKIKQLEIELKSMKELNSHLKVFLKKKLAKTEEFANKTADDLIDNATDLIINTPPKSSKSNTSSPGSETSKGSKKRSSGSETSKKSKGSKKRKTDDESKRRLKKRLVTIYGESGVGIRDERNIEWINRLTEWIKSKWNLVHWFDLANVRELPRILKQKPTQNF